MKVLVCGGGSYCDQEFMFKVLDALELGLDDAIIYGGFFGADALAGRWARSRNVPEIVFSADFKKFGDDAPRVNNFKMVTEGEPDIVIAFPGGKCTEHMMDTARKFNITLFYQLEQMA